MNEGVGVAEQVVLLGDGAIATELAASLEADGVAVLRVPSAPVAIATLDTVDTGCLVVVDEGDGGRPDDVFGAAYRQGHQVPGIYVGETARHLPAGVEQAPADAAAAAAQVRQRLLARAATEAEPAVDEDPLSAYGSTVAHELRNHLEAAGMAVEQLEGDTKDRAEAALERLADLATEAEAVATGQVSGLEFVSLSEAASDAADRIHAANATVTIEATGLVEANPALLTLLFENLFRNSVEHGSTGSRTESGDSVERGSTSSRTESGDSFEHGGSEVTIHVQDTDTGFVVADDGPGFERDDPFEWGYTTGSGQGTGLAVVRRIAQAHGWRVTAGNGGVSSDDDGGARIDVFVE